MSLHQFLKHVLSNPRPTGLSTEALATFIYENYFVPRKIIKKRKSTKQEQDKFVRQLCRANVFPYDWVPVPLKDIYSEGTIFFLDGLNILAKRKEWRQKGCLQYEIKLPTYCIEANKWYRFFRGDFHKIPIVPLARIYFNCSPHGAIALLNILSKVATNDDVSFGLKFALNLEHYNYRNDCGILYYKREDNVRLSKHINKVIKTLIRKKIIFDQKSCL